MISVALHLYLAVYRVAFLICLLSISWLAFGSPPSGVAASVSDKVLHAGAFVVLAYLLSGALPEQSFWKAVLPILLIYGLCIELVQWVLPHRDFSLLDLLADAVGVLLYRLFHIPIWKLSNLFFSIKRYQ